jgi:hypothetical protein
MHTDAACGLVYVAAVTQEKDPSKEKKEKKDKPDSSKDSKDKSKDKKVRGGHMGRAAAAAAPAPAAVAVAGFAYVMAVSTHSSYCSSTCRASCAVRWHFAMLAQRLQQRGGGVSRPADRQ